jgi:hypothetical protein
LPGFVTPQLTLQHAFALLHAAPPGRQQRPTRPDAVQTALGSQQSLACWQANSFWEQPQLPALQASEQQAPPSEQLAPWLSQVGEAHWPLKQTPSQQSEGTLQAAPEQGQVAGLLGQALSPAQQKGVWSSLQRSPSLRHGWPDTEPAPELPGKGARLQWQGPLGPQ